MLLRMNGYPISAGFGEIDSVHKIPHKGIDIAMPEGIPLHSLAEGIVSRVNDEGMFSFGKSVRIRFNDGTEVIYGHLSKINVKAHEHVDAGQIIGFSGNTGHSTGPHLHLQLMSSNGQLIDPTPIVQNQTWYQQLLHGQIPDAWKGPLYPSDDGRDVITRALGKWFSEKLDRLLDLLNSNSTEIITLGVIVCAFGMMVAPMLGSTAGRWFGRLFATLAVGVIWRMFI